MPNSTSLYIIHHVHSGQKVLSLFSRERIQSISCMRQTNHVTFNKPTAQYLNGPPGIKKFPSQSSVSVVVIMHAQVIICVCLRQYAYVLVCLCACVFIVLECMCLCFQTCTKRWVTVMSFKMHIKENKCINCILSVYKTCHVLAVSREKPSSNLCMSIQ